MQISCKITNTIIELFHQKGIDCEPLFEQVSISDELLRDPNFWIEQKELDLFLEKAISLSEDVFIEEDLLKHAGHHVVELRTWGALDSVLRMMPNPQEILQSPQKLLSYFISPCPSMHVVDRDEKKLKLRWHEPVYVTERVRQILKYSLESLPVFVGQPCAQISWSDQELEIQWNLEQTSIFKEQDPGRLVSPDLFHSVVSALQQTQREIEIRNKKITIKKSKYETSDQSLPTQVSFFDSAAVESAEESAQRLNDRMIKSLSKQQLEALESNLDSMSDYMVRAQQLITILSLNNTNNHLAQVAMKKTDWENVKNKFQNLISQSRQILDSSQGSVHPDQVSIQYQHQLEQSLQVENHKSIPITSYLQS